MKKILVPIDFSSCSKNALHNAIILAERMNKELVILHSYMLPMANADGTPFVVGSMIDEMEEVSKVNFDKFIKKVPDLSRIKYSTVITAGVLLDSIRDVIKKEEISFIVMGTHGASGLQKAFLGTNAYSVIKDVDCPVIALPEDADITKMKRIAMSGDYKKMPAPHCIEPIIELSQAFFAHVYVIHIDQDKNLEHDEIEIAKSLEKYLKKVKHSFHFKRDYDVEEGLLAFAKEEKIDLLTMISRHHSFLDRIAHASETKKMVMDIPMPLMIMPE